MGEQQPKNTDQSAQEIKKSNTLDVLLRQVLTNIKDGVVTIQSSIEHADQVQVADGGREELTSVVEKSLLQRHDRYIYILGQVYSQLGKLEVLAEYTKTLSNLGTLPPEESAIEEEVTKLGLLREELVKKIEEIFKSPAGVKIMEAASAANRNNSPGARAA